MRAASASEIRARLPELRALLVDAIESGASVGYVLPVDVELVDAFWRGIADDADAGLRQVFVAERDGELIGTAQLAPSSKPNQAHRADVQKLLVVRSARRQGVARAIMEAVERAAVEAGRWLLVLDTRAGSEADRLYRRLGWTELGSIPDYAADPDHALAPCTFFYKRLAPVDAAPGGGRDG